VSTTQAEFQAQFDFLVKVRDKVSEANQGVIDIRKTRDDLTYLKNKIAAHEKYKDVADRIKKFEEELNQMENAIHQTKNKSVQDPLNYGIKMNNRLAHLMVEQGQGDYPPTKQSEEVRQMLSKIVDEELIKVKTTIRTNLEVIDKMVKEKGIEIVF
jgi:septal ring factor EnvC (AmiA/AmiB activator)